MLLRGKISCGLAVQDGGLYTMKRCHIDLQASSMPMTGLADLEILLLSANGLL